MTEEGQVKQIYHGGKKSGDVFSLGLGVKEKQSDSQKENHKKGFGKDRCFSMSTVFTVFD